MNNRAYRLGDDEFSDLRRIIKTKTGINLGDHKRDLVISRLSRRLRSLGLSSFAEYVNLLDKSGDTGELVNMVNQITTNKTDFFREKHHFAFLEEILLPQLEIWGEQNGETILRCWSAGCSSGEEPYSLAMVMSEYFKDKPGWDFKILATDLDTAMLAKASHGIYSAEELVPVPAIYKQLFFRRLRRENEGSYEVRKALRNHITFRKFNLMHPEYPLKEGIDFIFCRNVLIYFDNNDKAKVLRQFHRLLRPRGHIFVGHSESLMMVKDKFGYVATTIYQKN